MFYLKPLCETRVERPYLHVVATADPSHRLEVVVAFDSLNDTLIDEIVCKLLVVSDDEEPEPVTIPNDEKRAIDDHEVGELSPDQLIAYLRTLPGAGKVDLRTVLARAPEPKAKGPSMLPRTRTL
jgi:hypothetical protein